MPGLMPDRPRSPFRQIGLRKLEREACQGLWERDSLRTNRYEHKYQVLEQRTISIHASSPFGSNVSSAAQFSSSGVQLLKHNPNLASTETSHPLLHVPFTRATLPGRSCHRQEGRTPNLGINHTVHRKVLERHDWCAHHPTCLAV